MQPMPEEHAVSFTAGTPETVLSPLSAEQHAALVAADSVDAGSRRPALGRVAATWPDCLQAWAGLAEIADDPIEQYAFARVGYHRGLDALRASGWRGSGYVRWRHEENRGFLRSLDALRRAAGAIGETGEQERCALFLRQLDPEWHASGSSPASSPSS